MRKDDWWSFLNDGRHVYSPLDRYPTLAKASSAQRGRWKMIGPGRGFHWEDLDLDLSLEGLVGGLPEMIPPPGIKR